MSISISASKEVQAQPEKIFSLLLNTEKRLKFHPSWEELKVKKLTPGEVEEGTRYSVYIRMEDAEKGAEYTLTVGEIEEPKRLVLYSSHGRTTTYTLEEGNSGIELRHEDVYEKTLSDRVAEHAQEDLELWLHGIKHYCELRKNPLARLSKLIVDHIMLRIPPMQRRVVYLIVVFNILLIFSIFFAIIVVAGANYFNVELFRS